MRYEQLVKDVLGQCRKAAADAEVFLQTRDELSIDVREGKLEILKQSASKGMGVRVLQDGRMSFVDSTDFSKGSVDSLVEKALSLVKVALADEHNVLPKPQGKSHNPAIYDPELKKIPREQKLKLALDVEERALAFDPLIKRSEGCSYFEVEGEVIVGNTLGIFETHRGTYCQIKVGVVAEKGESRQPGEYETASRYFGDLMEVDEIARNAGFRAAVMVGGEKVKSQVAPVIFDRVAGERLLNGLGDALSGEDVALGRSFLAGMAEQKMAADAVAVVDDGIMDRGVASRPVDAEGIPTRRRTMVDKGVLKGYLYNARGASRAKGESTGNASRWGYGSTPGTGRHNFYMVPGDLTPERIIQSTVSGLLVLQPIGFGVNSHSGAFSIGVSGVWIKDGKLSGPVVEVTVASNMLSMLQGIDAIGNDLVMDRGTACPTFRVKEMAIGGI